MTDVKLHEYEQKALEEEIKELVLEKDRTSPHSGSKSSSSKMKRRKQQNRKWPDQRTFKRFNSTLL